MPETGQSFRYEGMFDGRTSEGQPMENFPIHLRDGIGNSTLQAALEGIQGNHAFGEAKSTQALTQLLSCFAPASELITTEQTTVPNAESLLDQVGGAYFSFNHLGAEQQNEVKGLTQLLVWSVANSGQERKMHGVMQDISPHVRETAQQVLHDMDTWKEMQDVTLPESLDVSKLLSSKAVKVTASAGIALTLLSACQGFAEKTAVVSTQVATDTKPAIVQTIEPTKVPTYLIPAVGATETSVASTPTASTETHTPQAPLALPGVEFGAGGPDLIQTSLTQPLQNAVNDAGFGVVYSGEHTVDSKTGQTCLSAVPEKLVSNTNASGEQILKDTTTKPGIAVYEDTQVLAEVGLPKDTEDATYSCVLGYALPDNQDYQDGTLRQLLVKTNTGDGSVEVVASMQAGFSTADGVEVKSDVVYVNGEAQGWTVVEGQQLPVEKDYRADYEKVQADPWTATDVEKAGYDTYVRQQLAAKGIKDAETLSDYDLLEAVIDYQQGLIAKGGLANPEDYLVELPLSLHELIRTDKDNIVNFHREDSKGLWYGIGQDEGLTAEFLVNTTITYHLSFYGKDISANSLNMGVTGDLVLLYKTPGMDSNVGLGALIQMYNGDKVAYTEVFIPTATTSSSPGDLCLYSKVGEVEAAVSCATGTQRVQGYLVGDGFDWELITLENLLREMSRLKRPHIFVTPMFMHGEDAWSDGIETINNIEIQTTE